MSTARRGPAFRLAPLGRAMAFLAFAALAVVLLRPVCDALEPVQAAAAASGIQQDRHSPDEPCCESIGDGTLAAPSSAVAQAFDGGHDAIPQRAPALLVSGPALRRAVLDPPTRPPRVVPFHARTARILA